MPPPKTDFKVAIKSLKKQQIVGMKTGIAFLILEIQVHWALEECESVLQLLSLYEDNENIYMVLEY